MITKIIHNRIRKRIEAGKGMVHICDMGVLEAWGGWYYLFYHIIYGNLWFWWENFKWKFNCDFSHEFDEHIFYM